MPQKTRYSVLPLSADFGIDQSLSISHFSFPGIGHSIISKRSTVTKRTPTRNRKQMPKLEEDVPTSATIQPYGVCRN
jgi:hypothetical protein